MLSTLLFLLLQDRYTLTGDQAKTVEPALQKLRDAWDANLGGAWGDAKVAVIVYDDMAEYKAAGTPEQTVSWYNPAKKEILVTLDPQNRVSGAFNTVRWLALEGTRQYLHVAHAAAYDNPEFPGWLEEGLAERFSCAVTGADGKLELDSLTTVYADAYLKGVQRMLPKYQDVLKMDRETFYKDRAENSLAAWALVTYLLQARPAAIATLLEAFAAGKKRDEAYAAALAGDDGAPIPSAVLAKQVEAHFKKLKSDIKPRDDGTYVITETEHYTVQVENRAADLPSIMKQSQQMMELIFTRYQEAFGVKGKPTQKAIARLYGSQQAYYNAGAPRGSAAYYNPTTKELVGYFDPESFNIMCHEGCHQFFDLSFPGFYMQQDLPMWFSEGLADCFGAGEIKGKNMYIFTLKGVAEWRIPGLKTAVSRNRHTPLPDLLQMGQAEFMNPRMAGTHYAESWSFCHFLWNYPSNDGGNGRYKEVIINLIDGAKKGLPRDELYDKSFRVKGKKLDINKLAEEWEAYVKKLPG